MKKVLLFAAVALVALASCTSEEMIEVTNPQDNSPSGETNAIVFASATQGVTRAGEFVGATAAEKLGKMFVVEGTKGPEETDSPSKTVVFDNYLVGYDYNTAGTAKSNTHNWEYVGLQTGITSPLRMSSTTWGNLHSASTAAKEQSIKYWDYSVDQYDFIAWSTGTCEAVTTDAADGQVKVTRINTGTTLATDGFTMTAYDADDLLQCYYTDINTVTKTSGNYNKPVTLTFRNMAAKVRVALYETVPGYSVKEVMFYSAEATDPTAPNDLGSGTGTAATLFTTGNDKLPQSGAVTVYYPHIGTSNNTKDDYKKASVSVSVATGGITSTKQTFGTLADQYRAAEGHEPTGGKFLGRSLPEATYAGDVTKDFYQAVIPNTNGKPLTLRVDYKLVSTDGSGETINVYGAKAVVPATYTEWQPNYAYTYIFKISDNTNGWTHHTGGSPVGDPGLFPITFDAVVTSFIDANAEQTTVTTVATPSITTYQQGHDQSVSTNDEYSMSQTAGVSSDVKDVYVQVMDNSGATPALVTTLSADNSLLYKITKKNASDADVDYVASEAEVMDALQNRTDVYSTASPIVGRNSIKLTKDASHISNSVGSIINGVDDQPIGINAGEAAKIDIDQLALGTYAYVYVADGPSSDEKIYNVAGDVTDDDSAKKYYEVSLSATGTETPLAAGSKALAGKVYFVKNLKADDTFDSYTFKQTKVGDDVAGLVVADIPADKATAFHANSASNIYFYFDVYYRNNGKYAVKVIKVVN